jgi:hypothetical protein
MPASGRKIAAILTGRNVILQWAPPGSPPGYVSRGPSAPVLAKPTPGSLRAGGLLPQKSTRSERQPGEGDDRATPGEAPAAPSTSPDRRAPLPRRSLAQKVLPPATTARACSTKGPQRSRDGTQIVCKAPRPIFRWGKALGRGRHLGAACPKCGQSSPRMLGSQRPKFLSINLPRLRANDTRAVLAWVAYGRRGTARPPSSLRAGHGHHDRTQPKRAPD